MTRRGLFKWLLGLLFALLAVGFSLPGQVAVVTEGDIRGVFVGPGDRPFFIAVRQDSSRGWWVGGFVNPPTGAGCDWALSIYDDGGAAVQWAGSVVPLR